jgi:hypothetical protein
MKSDILRILKHKTMDSEILDTDVCIVGASFGGVAATWALAEAGCKAVLISEWPWIGGQATYQGVSCLDEHQWIENRIGATRRYFLFRDLIREYYGVLHPGNCWVSTLSFESQVAEKILRQILAPFQASGHLQILENTRLKDVIRNQNEISAIEVILDKDIVSRVRAKIFLDATDLGDLIAKAGIPYRVGRESRHETGEASAPSYADPNDVQAFCFPFAVEFCPGESHLIPKPPLYEEFHSKKVFTLNYPYPDKRRFISYGVFEKRKGLPGSFWEYRRLIDAKEFQGRNDVSLISWVSNDFRWGSIIDKPANIVSELLQMAKNLSLGFLYWLQTECPRDDGSAKGYPEFKLRKDLMGTPDGLAMAPYIRESRRIIPRSGKLITEELLRSDSQDEMTPIHFEDSVGVGHYMIDLHPQEGKPYTFIPTRPFEIPLFAFIPKECDNLLPASKNIGTTHITNGAYRVHHVEWGVGEAAGMLAAFSLKRSVLPPDISANKELVKELQSFLLAHGIPIHWSFPR